jgi:hypothetical protein
MDATRFQRTTSTRCSSARPRPAQSTHFSGIRSSLRSDKTRRRYIGRGESGADRTKLESPIRALTRGRRMRPTSLCSQSRLQHNHGRNPLSRSPPRRSTLRQQPTTNESAYDSMRRSPTTPKPVPCNSTLEFRCHPERDNNNCQEDHQNCAHDIPCFFFRARGGPEAEDS